MRARPLMPLALLAVVAALPTQAAVIQRDWLTPGDGLLTFDDVNQREWLDLTETQLFNFPGDTLLEQYQAVVAETLPGGDFAGFSVATEADVFALAESAGIDTSTTDYSTNLSASNRLITLLQATSSNIFGNKASAGFVTDLDVSAAYVSLVVERGGRIEPNTAGIVVRPFVDDDIGVWLYRPVPEPNSAIIGCLGCALLWGIQRGRNALPILTA